MTPEKAAEAIFLALCARARTDGADMGMTRLDLQAATGLTEESMMAVLRALRGSGNDQDLQVRFIDSDKDRIGLGPSWRARCNVTPS